jgi:hypothetical protein
LNNWKNDCAPNWAWPSDTVTDTGLVSDRTAPVRTAAAASVIVFPPPRTARGYPPRRSFLHPCVLPSRSPISSVSSTAKASLSRSPLHAPHRTPLSNERHHVDWPLRPSPEAAFTAMTSALANHRSTTSESVPSTTPPACRGCPPPPPAHARHHREASLVSLLLHR